MIDPLLIAHIERLIEIDGDLTVTVDPVDPAIYHFNKELVLTNQRLVWASRAGTVTALAVTPSDDSAHLIDFDVSDPVLTPVIALLARWREDEDPLELSIADPWSTTLFFH
jgi:hypothetical protein